jgi:hypothetical protein
MRFNRRWNYLLASDAKQERWLYPIAGGEPQELKLDVSPGENIFSFFADGKSVLGRTRNVPVKIARVDLATGHRELFREIVPADTAGAQSIPSLRFSADGKSYAYSLGRMLSDLYVVDGLK